MNLPPDTHPWPAAWRRLTARTPAAAGLALLAALLGALVLAAALLGDATRDPLPRALDAARISLSFAFLAGLLGAGIGLAWGLLAAALGGTAGRRLVETARGLAALPLVLAVPLAGGLSGHDKAMLLPAAALAAAPAVALATQAALRGLMRAEFLTAARASGATGREVLLHHLLPNAALPLLAAGWSALPRALAAEGFSGALGLGLPGGRAGLGTAIGAAVARGDAAGLLAPALLLGLTLWALGAVGDGLRAEADR
ncbi:ABC transporter permease subunit [Azospirillum sp. SYSU D00513]|uniref:ABC transporter permease subunit n=1 Tax=Azospirillum sp. SYSU D00513 TaxID=2812561 RepID=UPI001A960B59|nr:ABC transporter permease subunit [Azospirillum sp. SYSU D00513]